METVGSLIIIHILKAIGFAVRTEEIRKPPIPVAAASRAWVRSRSLAEIVGSNPAGGMDVCLLGV
jgi:hypothetical protein